MAIFDLNYPNDIELCRDYLLYCKEHKLKIEVKQKRKSRTYKQNKYLHLILSYFGNHFGYTLKEVKEEIFKKHVNSEIFYLNEIDSIVPLSTWRSSNDLNTEEMSMAIDRFIKFSSENGLNLPDSEDVKYLNEIENEINKFNNKKYL